METPNPVVSRVLVVEDVPAMRLLLRHALARAGMDVVEADSLASARRALQESPGITSVLLDLGLPDGHGLDLVGDVPAGMPIAALTADDSREIVQLCREAGCAGFFVKGEGHGDPAAIVRAIEGIAQTEAVRPVPDPELRRRYLDYLGEVIWDLDEASVSGDLLLLRKVVHRLRGTAVHFGHVRVGAGARAVSDAIAEGSIPHMKEAVVRLRDALGVARRGGSGA